MRPHPAVWLLVLSPAACSAPRIDNARLRSADLVAMTDRMTESLIGAEPVAQRGADSSPWVVTLDRVSNQTNDVIPEGEKWAFMARLRAELARSPAMRRRNITFVLPARWARRLSERADEAATDRPPPTHALAATFYGLTTATRQARTDTYLCGFQLVELGSGLIVWEDAYEVKRGTVRNVLD